MTPKRWGISEVFDEAVDLIGDQVAHHRAAKMEMDGRAVAALVQAAVALHAEQRAMLGKGEGKKIPDGALRDLLWAELQADPELWSFLTEKMDAHRASLS